MIHPHRIAFLLRCDTCGSANHLYQCSGHNMYGPSGCKRVYCVKHVKDYCSEHCTQGVLYIPELNHRSGVDSAGNKHECPGTDIKE